MNIRKLTLTVAAIALTLSLLAPTPVSAQTPPSVTTLAATNVSINSATVNGDLTSLGIVRIVSVFFEYGTTTSYGSVTTARKMNGTAAFSVSLIGLSPGTTYHFRAKAEGHDIAQGTDMTFTTATIPPAVSILAATNITINSATVSGSLTSLGTATSVEVFFEYGENTSYGSTTTAQVMTGAGAFSANLIGLSANTTYHFRAKAEGGVHGADNGTDMTFTTLILISPAVSTLAATDITINSATVNGNLTSLGTATPVEVFFEYGKNPSYGSTTTAQVMTGAGAFSANLIGLSSNTTYHFRVKVDGGVHGDAVGTDMTITTLTPPTVSTFEATDITINSAIVSGNLTSLGTAITVNVFFEYGTTTSYGSITTPQAMTDTGVFSANFVGRTPDTTYYFRAKVIGDGIATGTDMTFTTSIVPLVVNTSPATGVTSNAATLNGNLISLDAAVPVDVFFEYGTTTSYGSNTTAREMRVAGTFRANLTGLSANTTYHFRAKAVGDGIVTGADITFTTTATPLAAAVFTTGPLTISPGEVTAGKTVTISILVTNTGDLEGTYKARLEIDGVVTGTKDVTLAGGTSQTVTFTTSKDTAETYTVNVGAQSETFTVTAPIVPAQPTNWSLIGAIVAGGIALALAGYFLAWRKRFSLVPLLDKIYARFTDKRIVHTYTVRPLASGKHAMVIEFGVRAGLIEGLHVGVSIDAKLTNFRAWLDNPGTPTVTVMETGTFRKLAAGYRPQTREQQVRYIKLTPAVSYYWYLEAEEPLDLKDVLFLDYYDRRP